MKEISEIGVEFMKIIGTRLRIEAGDPRKLGKKANGTEFNISIEQVLLFFDITI